LVIIGLLLGGVLKGQELIANTKIKSVVADLEGVKAAYYAYMDRTGEVPGSSSSKPGEISSDVSFWIALREEGFIAGSTTAFLDNSFEPIQLAFSAQGAENNIVFFGGAVVLSSNPFGEVFRPITRAIGPKHALSGVLLANGPSDFFGTKNYICASNIDSDIAKGIDIKLDDGDAKTGSIRTDIDVEVSINSGDMIPTAQAGDDYPSLSTASVVPSVLCMALQIGSTCRAIGLKYDVKKNRYLSNWIPAKAGIQFFDFRTFINLKKCNHLKLMRFIQVN